MKKRTLLLAFTLLLAASTFVKAGDIPQPPLPECNPTVQDCPLGGTTQSVIPTDDPSDIPPDALTELAAEVLLYAVNALNAI